MIIEVLPNSNPYSYGSGNATKLQGPALPEIITSDEPDFCICDFIQCIFAERVFADPNSNDFWKNDKSEFLFKRIVPADTVDMELHKDDVKVADLNNNALGTYFDGFASGSSEQQLYKGYLLDWKLIEAAHGVGVYKLKATLNIIGNTTNFESRDFNLSIYSDIAAHMTVRMETVQNGNLIGNQFDFTDLKWYGSVRLPGTFGNPTPVYESDRYVTEQRVKRQIQDKMSREWTLSTTKISWEVAEVLIYNKLLANSILMTDYNIKAESLWRRKDVVTKDIEKKPTTGHPDKIYNINFEDKKDIVIKRNF